MILDGKALAKKVLAEVKAEVEKLERPPRLAVIQVGNDPASTKYVQNKEKDGKKCGIKVDTFHIDENVSPCSIIVEIDMMSDEYDGIILQLPLPERLAKHTQRIIDAIPPEKDVDGLTTTNMGYLMTGQPGLRPCTPMGIMRIFEEYNYNLRGMTVGMIGKSNLVGKPLMLMLEYAGATVVMFNSKTDEATKFDFGSMCDILISAVGDFCTVEHYTNSRNARIQTLIDVGINVKGDGTIEGDCDPVFAAEFLNHTPVPGGVGPMTRAYLMKNTLEAYKTQHDV